MGYSRDQIRSILCERLRRHDASDTFKADALRLCAARVAAGSGDLRKALQLCLRALEICRNDVGGGAQAQVTGRHLDVAAKDLLYANPATSAIAGLSCKTRRVLLSVLLELRRKESADVVPYARAISKYE